MNYYDLCITSGALDFYNKMVQ